MKTAELTGAILDYWVAKAEGLNPYFDAWIEDELYAEWQGRCDPYHPSKYWEQAGPIIDRERICISYMPSDAEPDIPRWYANPHSSVDHKGGCSRVGATALEAAMRCRVASKYGDEVPDAVPAAAIASLSI